MRIKYEFATGEVVEIEVTKDFGGIMVDIDREIYNNNRAESRRHSSLHKLEEAGFQAADPKGEVAAAVERIDRNKALKNAVDKLLPEQKELVRKVFFEEMSITEIAREEGVSVPAISSRLKKIYGKMKKSLS